jgi:hypothetical protein
MSLAQELMVLQEALFYSEEEEFRGAAYLGGTCGDIQRLCFRGWDELSLVTTRWKRRHFCVTVRREATRTERPLLW